MLPFTLHYTQHLLIVPYISGCGHCVTAKPAFSRLATTAKDTNLGVQVVAIDAAENPKVADFAGIQTLPTFKVFKSGKHLADYNGERNLEDMHEFCKQQVGKVNEEL